MEPTNDPQLSKLLREWQVEGAPAELDLRVLSICAPRQRLQVARRVFVFLAGSRKIHFAAAVLGVTFLVVVTQALPQTVKLISPRPAPPYTVESEYFRYSEDGLRTLEMTSTSYTNSNGGEVILERTVPEHLLETAAARTLDAVRPLLRPFTLHALSPSVSREELARRRATVGVVSGCGGETCLSLNNWFFVRAATGPSAPCAAGEVVGSETILGHPTTAVMRPMPNARATPNRPAEARITMWMAPDLGCFALRVAIEEQQPEGAFRLVSEKQALSVKMRP